MSDRQEMLSTSLGMISVIVPVFGAERFIRRCVDSILAQTYSHWELILVDDGSPDACGVICDAYARKDNRIRVVHQKNAGVSEARNRGLALSRGEYLYFADADDYLASDCFDAMLHFMEEKQADLVMSGYNRHEYDGTVSKESQWGDSGDEKIIREDILLDRLPNFLCGKLYRRNLWDGIVLPRGERMEDMYVMPEIFYRAKKPYLMGKPLYYYSRENAESGMIGCDISAYIRMRYGYFLAWKRHREIAVERAPHCEKDCIRHALHSAIRAYVLSEGSDALCMEKKETILSFLRQYRAFPLPFLETLERYAILNNIRQSIAIFGGVQRWIVGWQQARRKKKREWYESKNHAK